MIKNKVLCLTCASVSPSIAASCFRSGLVTYFWISNLFSRPFLCGLRNTALDHDLFLLYVCGIVSLVRTAYGPERHGGREGEDARLERNRNRREDSTAGVTEPDWAQLPVCSTQSYMWCLPGKVSWNWCWPVCLPLLLLPSELIMEDASLIPGSMEEKYWLAGGWTGRWMPDWRFELTMDVRSVTEREMRSYRTDTRTCVFAHTCSWSWPLTSLVFGG